jgi:hypothetical protein
VQFSLILLATGLFVPSGYFQSTVKHLVDLGDYMLLTWMTTSLATVAGALGSSLDDEETAREAVYGYRQKRRQTQGQERRKDANNSQDDSPVEKS